MKKDIKVAIVCDWLTTMGGAERVVLKLHEMFPDAPIYTSSYSPKRMPLFAQADVRTGFIQKLPFSSKHQLWPVLRRRYFSKLKLKDYDLVISSSGAEAKAVNMRLGDRRRKLGARKSPTPASRPPAPSTHSPTPNSQLPTPNNMKHPLHINYCHSPTQYYWVRPDEYLTAPTAGGIGFLNPLWRFGLKLLKPWMKRWDYLAAQNPDYMIANSTEVQKRIQKYYNRDSEVVWPPVDTKKFVAKPKTKRSGFLIVGRQVHHKRFDLAVKACTKLELPLTVIGNGPEHENLKSIAGPTITFLGHASDKTVAREFKTAEGYIFPQNDDFGIVAVEAMAAGTPVIAYKAGGALDTVKPGKTGLFFDEQTVESLTKVLKSWDKTTWNHNDIKLAASSFSTENFEKRLKQFIHRVI